MTIDQQVLNLINQERSNAGLNPLLLQSQLDSAANNHSEDMAVKDFFSHTSSNGTNWSDRISAVYQGSRLAENISAGLATPADVVQQWMNSRPHRANILDPNLEHIGIGYYHLPNDTGSVNYNHYWTLTFGAGGIPPVPVPNDDTNDTIAQATDTGLSGSGTYNISAEIDPQNDVDLFAVQLDAGDRLTADIDAQSIGSSLDPILTVFDSGGTLVAQNDDSDGLDSFIDFTANSAGNYYVGVSSYANSDYNPSVEDSGSGFSSGSYDLSLSICCDGSPDQAQSLDRLTPVDVQVGMLRGPNPQTFSDSVGDTDIVDTYAFSVRDFGPDSIYLANISLTGLSNDADIRLIEDYNSNGIVDSGEVLGSSINGGSLDESIVMGLDGGDYFLQVYQYSGDTNYQLTFA